LVDTEVSPTKEDAVYLNKKFQQVELRKLFKKTILSKKKLKTRQ
jgi:hypothetical protein